MDRENHITSLIASAHARADEALRHCRPSAATDHASPVAREWLRRWGPRRIMLSTPACGCAAGRCAVCN